MDFQGKFVMRNWKFRVEADVVPGEIMCITGSCSELGEWNPDNVVRMTCSVEIGPENE